MPMQWTLGRHDGVAVLSIRGALPDQDTRRLVGAVGWTCTHSHGPLVLDLSELSGWPAQGQSALGGAVRGWAAEPRPVALCLPPTSPLTITDPDLAALGRHRDLAHATAALRTTIRNA